MADDPKAPVPAQAQTAPPDPASVAPPPDFSETVPGGAYRFVGFDGTETWQDAQGNEIPKPKGT